MKKKNINFVIRKGVYNLNNLLLFNKAYPYYSSMVLPTEEGNEYILVDQINKYERGLPYHRGIRYAATVYFPILEISSVPTYDDDLGEVNSFFVLYNQESYPGSDDGLQFCQRYGNNRGGFFNSLSEREG